VYCDGCGEVAVPDDQLPVLLPDLRGQELAPKGASPLAAATDWVSTECPKCGGPAKRDTDTMDTFVDSSWYFLRYCSPSFEHGPFEVESVRRWSPVNLYVGGVEHAILHLLYSRFFVKVLHDMQMLDFVEPFTALVNQGQVINQGKAMSKSMGNGVDLGLQLAAHGVDAIRLTMIFASPPEDDIDWADMNPDALVKFLGRVWRVASEVAAAGAAGAGGGLAAGGLAAGDLAAGDVELRKVTHKTIDDVTRLVESTRLNVAVARLMELVSAARRAIDSGPGAGDPAVREAAEALAIMLSLFAPYTAEECWELLGHDPSIGRASWPAADPALLVQDRVTCVVQVDGKVRDRLEVAPSIAEDELRELALSAPGAERALAGRGVRTVIVRAPKLVNIVST
jgi:leucyl-tRNA synthetase